jgi:glycosyltransferase involved in cell wall biosynthesis
MTFIKFKEMFTQETYWYYQFFFNLSVNHADMIICDSMSTKKDLLEYDKTLSSDKINVIYLGVNKQQHIKSKTELKEKYNLPDAYYLFVGTISPRKNLLRVIKAWNQRINTDNKLVIIGKKGWLYNPFFEYIEKNNLSNGVLWLDYIPEADLPSLYSYAEALLFPSLYEGFGLPILEAMSCGCPVITSNISSMPEVAGDAALLVNPYNVDEIKAAMDIITYNKKRRNDCILKGYLQVKKFQWNDTAKQIITIYKKVSDIS